MNRLELLIRGTRQEFCEYIDRARELLERWEKDFDVPEDNPVRKYLEVASNIGRPQPDLNDAFRDAFDYKCRNCFIGNNPDVFKENPLIDRRDYILRTIGNSLKWRKRHDKALVEINDAWYERQNRIFQYKGELQRRMNTDLAAFILVVNSDE